MGAKPKAHTRILLILKDLHIAFPNLTIGHHLSLATADAGDLFKLEDTELLECLEKYKEQLEFNTVPDSELDKIIEEGKNLHNLFAEGEEWEVPY